MSASIETIVRVTITKGTQQVSVQGFGVPCVFGPSNRFGDAIRYYTSAADMLLDGFLTSDPEYIAVAEIFSQSPSPVEAGVSKFTAAVAQADTFQVNTLTSGHSYGFTINGTPITYTAGGGDTQQVILGALLTAAVAAFSPAVVSGAVVSTGPSAILTLTSTVAGIGVAYTAIDADLTHVALTPNHSISQDIATLQQIDDSWYGVIVTSRIASDIEQVAAYIETQKKIYITTNGDAGVISTATNDVASILKGKSYTRTAFLYSGTYATAPDAAWTGRMLPTTPGSSNWKFKTLAGITPDALTLTQSQNAQGKNSNIYVTIGGVNITSEGIVSSGEYIDVTILIDWIVANMEANVYSVLVNNDKVPYTNKGIAQIEAAVRATLVQAEANGGLAPGWTVTTPNVANVSSADKASRTLNNVSFQATLAGAINKVIIQGFVSV